MSFLGRTATSSRTLQIYGRRNVAQSRRQQQEIVPVSSSCSSARHLATASNPVPGGKLLPQKIVSTNNNKPLFNHARRTSSLQGGDAAATMEQPQETWSAFEFATVSLLAVAACAAMIVKDPRAQSEPSVDATTAPPTTSPQHQRFAIVQRGPKHRSNALKNFNSDSQYADDHEDGESSFEQAVSSFTKPVRPKQETGDTAVPDSNTYDVSVRAIKGKRVTMEDEYFVAPGGRFAAVFDGHGGGGVSAWLRTQLYPLMVHYLKETAWEEQEMEDEKENRTPSVSAHVGALRKAFAQAEKDVVSQEVLSYQGSTAVAVFVHESDDGHRTLISANVGDSRAILSRQGKAIDLTRDHKPNEEREKARILNMGEAIEWDSLSKVHRVRNLSLSRAIGDRYAKPVVSSQVEIKLFPVAEDGDEFFLLASDGLWDVMSSQDVVSYVHQRFETELSREQLQTSEDRENYKLVLRRNMARALTREALRRGTGDNICVLMVWLKDLPGGKK